MYQAYCGGSLIYDYSVDDLRLAAANLDLELGKTGSFQFIIYPDNPSYGSVEPMALVTVSRNYETIYTGRVLNITYGLHNEKQVSCEGELAFLLDSMIAPHSYTGSFVGYLAYIVGLHNAQVESEKQFVPGAVTVGEFYPFVAGEKYDYISAFDTLTNKMVGPSGGYLQVRYENGYRYLDLLSSAADVSNVSGQTIELGKNLLDIKREFVGEDVFSAIIPLGAKIGDTDARLDIKGVNSGLPYIVNTDAQRLCKGTICRPVVFDNITNAQTLKAEAESYLADNYAGETSIEVTAADLSGTGQAVDFFRVGQWVKVYSYHHFTENPQLFLVKKLSINLLSPAQNKLVIGKVKRGFSEEVASLSNSVSSIPAPETVQPYVVESGTTGIWTWKKFSDSTCEFIGKIPVTSADVTTALGGWFRGLNLYEATAYEYPLAMTEAPALNMMFQTRNGLAALLWVNSPDAETAQSYLPQSFLIRPTSATGIHGNINIIGKGKL